MHSAFLLLGSNTGDRDAIIKSALDALSSAGCILTAQSRMWETAPWGNTAQDAFLNMAACVETDKKPEALLSVLLHIEKSRGRIRQEKWAPRTLDIDILFYDVAVIDLPHLKIPHPFLQDRRFALAPLAEIAPDYVHPVLQKNVYKLLQECRDTSQVSPLS